MMLQLVASIAVVADVLASDAFTLLAVKADEAAAVAELAALVACVVAEARSTIKSSFCRVCICCSGCEPEEV